MAAFRGGQNPLSQMDTLREVYANLSHQPPSEAAGDDALGGAAAPFSLGSFGDDFGDAMAAARAADGGLVAPPGEDLGSDLLEAAQRLDGDETRARAASARARPRVTVVSFAGPQAYDRDVALAIFNIGLRQASPKVIKALMVEQPDALDAAATLTTEHIKSHLQKYRQHHDRSTEGFLGHYATHLRLDHAPRPAAEPAPAAADAAAAESSAASVASAASGASSLDAPRPRASRKRPAADALELEQLRHTHAVQTDLLEAQLRLHDELRADLDEHADLHDELARFHRADLARR